MLVIIGLLIFGLIVGSLFMYIVIHNNPPVKIPIMVWFLIFVVLYAILLTIDRV